MREEMHVQTARRVSATACVAVTMLAIVVAPGRASAFLTPNRDPFYRAPANLAARMDATVLRMRSVTPTMLSLPMAAHATQILFKSIDAHRRPTTDVATVLVPTARWRGNGPRPLVSFQSAEDGVGSACAPSYALRAGLGAATSNSELETPIIALLLTRGWAVVTTDYEGPQSQFLAGRQEGYAVLDGVRAALRSHVGGLGRQTPVALWGYSGGAFATAWAAQMRATHAPDLRLAGIAFGGLPANLAASMRKIDGGYGFGLVFGALIGLNRAYPEARLSSLMNSQGLANLQRSRNACTLQLLAGYAFRRLSSYTNSTHPYDTALLRAVLAANSPGTARTTTPVYSYHAMADELVPVSVENALIAKYCAAGDRVQIIRTPGSSHNTELLTGAPGAIAFLAHRFAGAPPVDNCPR
jgi:pimeloyl-ACP methyl ester carboxylesterase